MNTVEKHQSWELDVQGFDRPVLASFVIEHMSAGTQDTTIAQSILKSHIAKVSMDGSDYAKCGSCGCPVLFIAKSAAADAHFRHNPNKAPNLSKMKVCSFYTGTDSFFGNSEIYKGEGKWHFETKHMLAEFLENTGLYKNIRVEKFIFSKDPEVDARRRPDISFLDDQGNAYAIELTRWWMSPETVQQREQFFRQQAINLIWLFSPNCEESNRTTLNMILYGSAAAREDACPNVLAKVECNAFVLSDSAVDEMNRQNKVVFEVRYPLAQFHRNTNEIAIVQHNDLVPLESLDLNPSKRLPFAVPTSSSFKTALTEKRLFERRRASAAIKELRQLAYHTIYLGSEAQYDDLVNRMAFLRTQASTCRFKRSIDRYLKLASENTATAHSDYHARIARKNAASAVRKYRKSVRSLLRTAHSTRYERDVRLMKERIENVVQVAAPYHSKHLLHFFSRALRSVNAKLTEFESRHASANAMHSRSRENHIIELDTFIADLESGRVDMVFDESVLKIKKSRVTQAAHKYGFADKARRLETVFHSAMERARTNYLASEYPCLHKGWNDTLRFKPDLDKAIYRQSLEVPRRDPNANVLSVHQRQARLVLKDFIGSLMSGIEKAYTDMVSADTPQLACLLAKESRHWQRMVECTRYLEGNSINIALGVGFRLDVIATCIQNYQRGVSFATLKDQIAIVSREIE